MVSLTPIQPNFNGGELSPLLEGRVDLAAYRKGLRQCTNWVPLAQGPLTRRPGTVFVREVKDSSKTTRLLRFVFSATQAYVLEIGDYYMRFYTNRGVILSGGSPYEIVTPYPHTVVEQLYIYQSADTLYLLHPNYAPRVLSRLSDTSWTLAEYAFKDGPYLPMNTTTTMISSSGTTGSVTLTASASLFASTDVGRLVRITNGGTAGWCKITAYTSATVVTATVYSALSGTGATVDWRLGLFSDTTGWPSCGSFLANRHYVAGSRSHPSTIAGSRVGEFDNFSPTTLAGLTAADDDGFTFTLGSDQVERIVWLAAVNSGLGVGTIEGEWVLRASSFGEAITATNANAVTVSAVGSAAVQPLRALDEVLYVQSARKQLWSYGYDAGADAFATNDRTLFADHITVGNIRSLAFQRNPHAIVWAADDAGGLLGFTNNRKQEVFAWHKHTTDGSVKHVVAIPDPTNTADDLWMLVQRTVNGSSKQYVEYMAPFFSYGTAAADAKLVDCSLTYSGSPATVFSGLGHLEGKSVVAIADGGQTLPATVVSGSITIAVAASKVTVGLPVTAVALLQRPEFGNAATQTAQGDRKMVGTMFVRLWRSLGVKVGEELSKVKLVNYRGTGDIINEPVPLVTGDAEVVFPGGYSYEGDIYVVNDSVYPSTVLSLVSEMQVSE